MIAATSWFLVTLAGLGLPVAALLAGVEARQSWRSGHDTAGAAALALMLGLLVDHAAGVVTGSLASQAALAWVGAVALAGGLVIFVRAGGAVGAVNALATVVLISLLAMVVYATPLLDRKSVV